jgi:hypothetical protein
VDIGAVIFEQFSVKRKVIGIGEVTAEREKSSGIAFSKRVDFPNVGHTP